MGAPKVKYNATTGRWEVVLEDIGSSVGFNGVERRSKVRGTIDGRAKVGNTEPATGGYDVRDEFMNGEKVKVAYAPTLKGRMKNNVDADAGDGRFVMSNQVREISEKSQNKPTRESVQEEIANLDPELRAIFETYGGK